MFHFSTFAPDAYTFSVRYPEGWVAPFRNPKVNACLPARLGLSQVTASFIASRHQDIRRTPFCSVIPTGRRASRFRSAFRTVVYRRWVKDTSSSLRRSDPIGLLIQGCPFLSSPISSSTRSRQLRLGAARTRFFLCSFTFFGNSSTAGFLPCLAAQLHSDAPPRSESYLIVLIQLSKNRHSARRPKVAALPGPGFRTRFPICRSRSCGRLRWGRMLSVSPATSSGVARAFCTF